MNPSDASRTTIAAADGASDLALAKMLPRALVALRLTLGLFLLRWGVEKFVVPANTPAIWGCFMARACRR